LGRPDEKIYITFPNHNEGLRLSKELKALGIKYTISPTPRSVSACCGISLIVLDKDRGTISRLIEEKGIRIEAIVPFLARKNSPYRGSC